MIDFFTSILSLISSLDNVNQPIVLTISSSRNTNDVLKGSYIGGTRYSDLFIVVSCVIADEYDFRKLLPLVCDSVNYLFVELEKRLPLALEKDLFDTAGRPCLANLFQIASEFVYSNQLSCKLYPYAVTDVTAESALQYVLHWSSNKQRLWSVSVLGAGSIGTKIAFKLVEAGFNVRLWNRTYSKSQLASEFINTFTAPFTIARCSPCSNLEASIASTSACISVVTQSGYLDPRSLAYINTPGFFLDVGKNALDIRKLCTVDFLTGIELLRCDISWSLLRYINSYISADSFRWPQVCQVNDTRFIEPGILGYPGDLVVNSLGPDQKVLGRVTESGHIESD